MDYSKISHYSLYGEMDLHGTEIEEFGDGFYESKNEVVKAMLIEIVRNTWGGIRLCLDFNEVGASRP